MKQRVNGMEALKNGMNRAGITKIMLSLMEWDDRMYEVLNHQKLDKTCIETLKSTEEAICSVSFFSQKGENAACLIREDELYRLAPLLEENTVREESGTGTGSRKAGRGSGTGSSNGRRGSGTESSNGRRGSGTGSSNGRRGSGTGTLAGKGSRGALLIIVVGDEEYKYMNMLSLYGVDYVVACDPETAMEMICDGSEYSSLTGRIAVMYLPKRILISSMWVDVKTIHGNGTVVGRKSARQKRAEGILAKYDTENTNDKAVILVTEDLEDIVKSRNDLTGDAAVIGLKLIRSDSVHSLPFPCRRVLIIGKGRSLIYAPVPEKNGRKVILKNDIHCFEEEIGKMMDDFFSDHGKQKADDGSLSYDEGDSDVLRVRIPEAGYGDEIMCPGCMYRRYVAKALGSGKYGSGGYISFSEDFFCIHRMSRVVTGITGECGEYGKHGEYGVYGKGAVPGGIMFTNRMGGEYPGASEVIFVEEDCPRDGNIAPEGRSCRIIQERCDGCGVCIRQTGCPALWSRGLKVFIDETVCTGCGLCVKMCERRAIDHVR